MNNVEYPKINSGENKLIERKEKKNINIVYTVAIKNPLWIINYESKALLLYDNLPCHNSKVFRELNLRIEKSEANAAYFPSLPSIPMPTSPA